MVLKFHMQHDQTAGLQNDRIQLSRESKTATMAKISKTNILFIQKHLVYLAEILFGALVGTWFSELSK